MGVRRESHPPVSIEQRAGQDPQLVLNFWKNTKSLASARNRISGRNEDGGFNRNRICLKDIVVIFSAGVFFLANSFGSRIFTASRKHFTHFLFLLFIRYLNSSKNFRVSTQILPRTIFLMHVICLCALRFPARRCGLTVVFKNNECYINP